MESDCGGCSGSVGGAAVRGATGTPAGVVVTNVSSTGSVKGLAFWSAAPAGATAFPGDLGVNGREKKKMRESRPARDASERDAMEVDATCSMCWAGEGTKRREGGND